VNFTQSNFTIVNSGFGLDSTYLFLQRLIANPTINGTMVLGSIPPYRPSEINDISMDLQNKVISYVPNTSYDDTIQHAYLTCYTFIFYLRGFDYSVSPPIIYELSDNPIFTGRYVVTNNNTVVYMEDASNAGVNILRENTTYYAGNYVNYLTNITPQIDASGIPYLKSRIPQAKYFRISDFYYSPYAYWSSDGITYRYDTDSYTNYRDSSGVYWGVYYGSGSGETTQIPITIEALNATLYSASILKKLEYSVYDLFSIGYSVKSLKDASFSVIDVKYAGYTLSEVIAQYTEAELTQTFNFDISSSVWNNTYPIVNAGGSFVDISGNTIQSGVVSTNGNTKSVSWSWVFYSNRSVNDGLSFNKNVVSYGNDRSINIKKFDGIILCNMDSSANATFNGFAGIISAIDTPRIINTSMAYCFSNSKSTNLGSINNWDTLIVTNMSNMFNGSTSFNQTLNWFTKSVTNISGMFKNASSFNSPLYITTNKVTNMSEIFYAASKFNQLLNWTTTLVTDMSGVFFRASVFNQSLSNWNTSNVTNMSNMFNYATKFNQPLDTSGNYWNVSKVTDMNSMFSNTFFDQSLNNWNTSSVTNMSYMFYKDASFNKPLSNWNTANVTNMNNMFYGATRFNQSLDTDGNKWNVSNVTDMNAMFYNSIAFDQSLNNWNTSSVTNMSNMFYGAKVFKKPLSNWNTANVTNMRNMFYGATLFNQPLSDWNTANVTNMGNMFYGLSEFNQSLDTSGNKWNVSNVTDMSGMFYNNIVFDQSLNNWDTTNVTNMTNMFYGAKKFNRPLGNWNTANVTNMSKMFYGATLFNQPLDTSGNKWNVSNVTDMNGMFYYTSYNYPVGNWNTANVTNMSNMFSGISTFNKPIGTWDFTNLGNISNIITNTGYSLQESYTFLSDIANNNTINVDSYLSLGEIPPVRSLESYIDSALSDKNITYSSIYNLIMNQTYLKFYSLTLKNTSNTVIFNGKMVVLNSTNIIYLEDVSNAGVNIVSTNEDFENRRFTSTGNIKIIVDSSNIISLNTLYPLASKFLFVVNSLYYNDTIISNKIGTYTITQITGANATSLFQRFKYTIPYLKEKGYSSRELNTSGYTRQELLDASYTLLEFLTGGYDMSGISNSFVFDISNTDYTGTITEPITNTSHSFYDVATDVSVNSATTTVSFYWKTYTDLSSNDGLILNPYVTPYGYARSINIRKFDRIPLRYMDSSANGAFGYFRGSITATDSPTVPNKSLAYCFYHAKPKNTINLSYWDVSGVTNMTNCFAQLPF